MGFLERSEQTVSLSGIEFADITAESLPIIPKEVNNLAISKKINLQREIVQSKISFQMGTTDSHKNTKEVLPCPIKRQALLHPNKFRSRLK
jgi:hypothetical protein